MVQYAGYRTVTAEIAGANPVIGALGEMADWEGTPLKREHNVGSNPAFTTPLARGYGLRCWPPCARGLAGLG